MSFEKNPLAQLEQSTYIDEEGNLRIGDFIIGNIHNNTRKERSDKVQKIIDKLEELDIDPIEDDKLDKISEKLLTQIVEYTNYRRQYYSQTRDSYEFDELIEKDIQMFSTIIYELYNNQFTSYDDDDEDEDESECDYTWDQYLMDSVEDTIKRSIDHGVLYMLSRHIIVMRQKMDKSDSRGRYDYPIRRDDARCIVAYEVGKFRKSLKKRIKAGLLKNFNKSRKR